MSSPQRPHAGRGRQQPAQPDGNEAYRDLPHARRPVDRQRLDGFSYAATARSRTAERDRPVAERLPAPRGGGRSGQGRSGHRRADGPSGHGLGSLLAVCGLAVLVLLGFVWLRASRAGDPAAPAPTSAPGELTAGDCLANPATGRTAKVPCGGAHYATVTARVDTTAQCAPPAAEALSLGKDSTGKQVVHPVLCLQPAAIVGACIGSSVVGPAGAVPCTDPQAAKVLARVAVAKSCPTGTLKTIKAVYPLPGKELICVGKPR